MPVQYNTPDPVPEIAVQHLRVPLQYSTTGEVQRNGPQFIFMLTTFFVMIYQAAMLCGHTIIYPMEGRKCYP